MRAAPGIVRWLPLAVLLTACSGDTTTAPEAVDSDALMAPAGKKVGADASNVMEPKRAIQAAAWDAGYLKDYRNQPTTTATFRVCETNSLEDLDGSDFYSLHAGGFVEEQVTEQDGFVLVSEGGSSFEAQTDPPDVYVGRATWNATIWLNNGDLHSINSLTKGVVAPLRLGGVPVSAEAAALLDALNGGWALPAAGYKYDVERAPLTPDAGPTALISSILADAAAHGGLRGVVCDWQQTVGWIKANTITYEKSWPAHLDKLY